MFAVSHADPLHTEEAVALREAVRALLGKRSGSEAMRAAMSSSLGYDDKLWATLCEQIGVAALAVPEEYGGAGAGIAEVCVVMEELGRALTPSPMLGSAVVSVQALLGTGNGAVCRRLIPDLASGNTVAALAWSGEDGAWSPHSPACSFADGVLDGRAHYVLDGHLADIVLVVARTPDGTGLFEVEPHRADLVRITSLDPTRRLGVVQFVSAPAHRLDTGEFTPALREVRDLAVVAVAAEQVGAAARALELTVEYALQRRQFGRPIGSFQALKHRMADVHVHIEAARSALYAAVIAMAEPSPLPCADEVAAAKLVCSEAFAHAAAEMIQIHGGIAITWEHDAHLYFKRAHGSALLFGPPTVQT